MAMKRILVIHESHPGHLTQSRGLATALAARSGAAVEVFDVRMTARGSFRPLLRFLLRLFPKGLPDALLRFAYDWSGDTRPLQADVVVSSGGQSIPFAVSIARRLGAKYVFCGDPAPWPAHWCDVVLSPVPIPGHPCAIVTELLLTDMSPERVAGRGGAYRQAFAASGGGTLAALLVGGDSRSHRYMTADWEALAAGINRLGEQGWRWLLSTSRRTPPEAEHILRERVDPRWLVKAVWWHAQPERVLVDFLGAADVVGVTQDSLSMLSEAMASGRPVLSLVPAEVRPSAFLEAVLAGQEARRRLARVPLSRLGELGANHVALEPVQHSLADQYAHTVAAFLAATPSR